MRPRCLDGEARNPLATGRADGVNWTTSIRRLAPGCITIGNGGSPRGASPGKRNRASRSEVSCAVPVLAEKNHHRRSSTAARWCGARVPHRAARCKRCSKHRSTSETPLKSGHPRGEVWAGRPRLPHVPIARCYLAGSPIEPPAIRDGSTRNEPQSSGRGPGGIPACCDRLITRTSTSDSTRIWQESRIFGSPGRPSRSSRSFSSRAPWRGTLAVEHLDAAGVVRKASMPPHRWRMSMPASSIARTSFFPASTSTAFSPWIVTVGIGSDLPQLRECPGQTTAPEATGSLTRAGSDRNRRGWPQLRDGPTPTQ